MADGRAGRSRRAGSCAAARGASRSGVPGSTRRPECRDRRDVSPTIRQARLDRRVDWPGHVVATPARRTVGRSATAATHGTVNAGVRGVIGRGTLRAIGGASGSPPTGDPHVHGSEPCVSTSSGAWAGRRADQRGDRAGRADRCGACEPRPSAPSCVDRRPHRSRRVAPADETASDHRGASTARRPDPIRCSRAGVSAAHSATSTTAIAISSHEAQPEVAGDVAGDPERERRDGRQDVADQQHQRGGRRHVRRPPADVHRQRQHDREDGAHPGPEHDRPEHARIGHDDDPDQADEDEQRRRDQLAAPRPDPVGAERHHGRRRPASRRRTARPGWRRRARTSRARRRPPRAT